MIWLAKGLPVTSSEIAPRRSAHANLRSEVGLLDLEHRFPNFLWQSPKLLERRELSATSGRQLEIVTFCDF